MKHLLPATVCALIVLTRAVSAQTTTLADDFEGSSLAPFWTPHSQSGSITFPSTVQAHGGSQAIQFNSVVTAAQKSIGVGHVFAQPTYGQVSVWLYDTGANASSSNYLILSASPFSVVTRDYNLGGPSGGGNYEYQIQPNAPVTTPIARTEAWHHFSISTSPSASSVAVDGVTVYSGPGGIPFTEVSIAMFGPSWRPAWVSYWDDFSFSPFAPGQANSACAALTVNGAGASGPGPFTVGVPAGSSLELAWSGPANQPFMLVATSNLIPGQSFGGSLIVDVDLGASVVVFSGFDPFLGFLYFTSAAGAAAQSFSVPMAAAGFVLRFQGVVFDGMSACPDGMSLMTTASFTVEL